MNEDPSCTAISDENGRSYNDRLKDLRIRTGKTQQDVCDLLVMDLHHYEELETYSSELTEVASIYEISRIARVLGVPSRAIFSDTVVTGEPISLGELSLKIKNHLNTNRVSMEEFENQVGYEIGTSIDNSSKMLDWSLDCLRFVCVEIGVDWLNALP